MLCLNIPPIKTDVFILRLPDIGIRLIKDGIMYRIAFEESSATQNNIIHREGGKFSRGICPLILHYHTSTKDHLVRKECGLVQTLPSLVTEQIANEQ
jgi:hypothetical protein